MSEDRNEDREDSLAKVANYLVSGGLTTLGTLKAALGDQGAAATIIGAAPLFGYSAEKGVVLLRAKVGRGVKWGSRIFKRAEEEGKDLEQVPELVEAGISLVQEDGSEDKAYFAEQLLFGTLELGPSVARRTVALDLMGIAEQMDALAAYVMRAICDTLGEEKDAWYPVPLSGPLSEIAEPHLQRGLAKLHSLQLLGSQLEASSLRVNLSPIGLVFVEYMRARRAEQPKEPPA